LFFAISVSDFDAHGAGGAGDDFDGAGGVDGVQLVFFDFGDVLEVAARDFADFFEVGFAAAFFDFEFFADEVVDGLAEAFPVEGAVVVDGDVDDDVFAIILFGFFVEGVNEVHHI